MLWLSRGNAPVLFGRRRNPQVGAPRGCQGLAQLGELAGVSCPRRCLRTSQVVQHRVICPVAADRRRPGRSGSRHVLRPARRAGRPRRQFQGADRGRRQFQGTDRGRRPRHSREAGSVRHPEQLAGLHDRAGHRVDGHDLCYDLPRVGRRLRLRRDGPQRLAWPDHNLVHTLITSTAVAMTVRATVASRTARAPTTRRPRRVSRSGAASCRPGWASWPGGSTQRAGRRCPAEDCWPPAGCRPRACPAERGCPPGDCCPANRVCRAEGCCRS
jgi:hypothetical protein